MKKVLVTMLASAMLLTAASAHAEQDDLTTEEVSLMGMTDGNASLLAIPESDISGDANDGKLTQEEIDEIKAITMEAIEGNIHPENVENAENYISIKIPEDISIDISIDDNGYPAGRMNAAMNAVQNIIDDNPQYFYVDPGPSAFMQKSDGTLHSVLRLYRDGFSTEEAQSETADKINEKANNIITQMYDSGVRKDSDFDKALWLHDYLISTIEYDGTLANRTLDTALLDGRTVCHGYVGAYKYLLGKVGVECVNIYSNVESHVWSAVKLDDNWYYVDVTQDDITPDRLGNVSHALFLLTEDELANAFGTHRYGFSIHGDITCTDTSYSGADWRKTSTKIAFNGSDRYYAVFDNEKQYTVIYKCSDNFSEAVPFYEITDGVWYVNQERTNYLNKYYGGIEIYDNNLYFNTYDTIQRIDLTDDKPEAQKALHGFNIESPASMYGLMINDDVLNFTTAEIAVEEDPDTPGSYSVSFLNQRRYEVQLPIPLNTYEVTFMDGEEIIGTVTANEGEALEIPGYMKYGCFVDGWETDDGSEWDFDEDVVTSDMTLYVKTSPITINRSWGEKVNDEENGTVLFESGFEINEFDTKYQSLKLIYALYDKDGRLMAVKSSETNSVGFDKDDNVMISEDDDYAAKGFIWNDDMTAFGGAYEYTPFNDEVQEPDEEDIHE